MGRTIPCLACGGLADATVDNGTLSWTCRLCGEVGAYPLGNCPMDSYLDAWRERRHGSAPLDARDDAFLEASRQRR
jgi:hypothetical protein